MLISSLYLSCNERYDLRCCFSFLHWVRPLFFFPDQLYAVAAREKEIFSGEAGKSRRKREICPVIEGERIGLEGERESGGGGRRNFFFPRPSHHDELIPTVKAGGRRGGVFFRDCFWPHPLLCPLLLLSPSLQRVAKSSPLSLTTVLHSSSIYIVVGRRYSRLMRFPEQKFARLKDVAHFPSSGLCTFRLYIYMYYFCVLAGVLDPPSGHLPVDRGSLHLHHGPALRVVPLGPHGRLDRQAQEPEDVGLGGLWMPGVYSPQGYSTILPSSFSSRTMFRFRSPRLPTRPGW